MQCDNIHPSPRDFFPSHSHQSTSLQWALSYLISSSPSICPSLLPASLPPILCLLSLPPFFRPRAGNHSCYVFVITSVISCPEDGAPTTLLPTFGFHSPSSPPPALFLGRGDTDVSFGAEHSIRHLFPVHWSVMGPQGFPSCACELC